MSSQHKKNLGIWTDSHVAKYPVARNIMHTIIWTEKILWTLLWNFYSEYKQRMECIRFMKLEKKLKQ